MYKQKQAKKEFECECVDCPPDLPAGDYSYEHDLEECRSHLQQ